MDWMSRRCTGIRPRSRMNKAREAGEKLAEELAPTFEVIAEMREVMANQSAILADAEIEVAQLRELLRIINERKFRREVSWSGPRGWSVNLTDDEARRIEAALGEESKKEASKRK